MNQFDERIPADTKAFLASIAFTLAEGDKLKHDLFVSSINLAVSCGVTAACAELDKTFKEMDQKAGS